MTAPRFFVPGCEDESKKAEKLWQGTVSFMEEQSFGPIEPRRIYSIHYYQCHDKIGGMDRYGMEKILVLLDAGAMYLCCTANRGVFRGEPILIGKGQPRPRVLEDVVEFSE